MRKTELKPNLFVELYCLFLMIFAANATTSTNERVTTLKPIAFRPKNKELCSAPTCVRYFQDKRMFTHFSSQASNIKESFDYVYLTVHCGNHKAKNICHIPIWNLENYANGSCTLEGNSTHGYTITANGGLEYKYCQTNATFILSTHCMQQPGLSRINPSVTVEVKDAAGQTTSGDEKPVCTQPCGNVTTPGKTTKSEHVATTNTTLVPSGSAARKVIATSLVMLACLGLAMKYNL